MVETEAFLLETGDAPMDQFGPPAGYADTVAAALEPDARRRQTPGPRVVEVDAVGDTGVPASGPNSGRVMIEPVRRLVLGQPFCRGSAVDPLEELGEVGQLVEPEGC